MPKINVNTPLHKSISQGLEDSGMEGINEVNVFVKSKQVKYNKNEEFFHMFIDKNQEVVKGMLPSTLKVYFWFCTCLKYGNFVECVVEDIVIWTDISRRSVQKALNQLKEREIIIPYKNPNDTRNNFYQINPLLVWRGNAQDRKKTIKELQKKNQLELPLWYDNKVATKPTTPAMRELSQRLQEERDATRTTL
jgi:hypothetical protein